MGGKQKDGLPKNNVNLSFFACEHEMFQNIQNTGVLNYIN